MYIYKIGGRKMKWRETMNAGTKQEKSDRCTKEKENQKLAAQNCTRWKE